MSMTDQKVLLDQCASSNTPLQPCALVSALKSPNQFHHDVFLFGFASFDQALFWSNIVIKEIATAVTLEIVSMPSIEWQIKPPWSPRTGNYRACSYQTGVLMLCFNELRVVLFWDKKERNKLNIRKKTYSGWKVPLDVRTYIPPRLDGFVMFIHTFWHVLIPALNSNPGRRIRARSGKWTRHNNCNLEI